MWSESCFQYAPLLYFALTWMAQANSVLSDLEDMEGEPWSEGKAPRTFRVARYKQAKAALETLGVIPKVVAIRCTFYQILQRKNFKIKSGKLILS